MYRILNLLIACICFIPCIYAEHFLTFIIPCYNCENWIKEAVESIYQQHSLKCPFEIICTDDASTDTTYSILTTLSHKHPEMIIVRHKQNRGGGAARNTCVAHSRGDIIFCLDSDNVLVPNSVQQLIDRMDETRSDIVTFGGLRYFRESFIEAGSVYYSTPSQYYTLKDALEDSNCPAWSGNYLYSRRSFDAVGGYPAQWGALDTYTFGFLKLLKGFQMTYVPGTHYWHRHGIESYYVRDARAKTLNSNFYKFMLKHHHLFTKDTVQMLKKQLNLINSGKHFKDLNWFFANRALKLKNP